MSKEKKSIERKGIKEIKTNQANVRVCTFKIVSWFILK